MDRGSAEGDGEPEADDVDDDWQRRPYARTFDLISGEYGWTDDQILDLTLARMRQIRDVIAGRKAADWKRDVRVQERVMQNLMSAVYAAAGSKKGANAAHDTRIIPDDDEEPGAKKKRRIPTVETVSRVFSIDKRYGMYSQDEIAAEMERQRAAQAAA